VNPGVECFYLVCVHLSTANFNGHPMLDDFGESLDTTYRKNSQEMGWVGGDQSLRPSGSLTIP